MFVVNPLVEFNIAGRIATVSRELSALSDSQLRDIGLERDQLHALVEARARRKAREAVRRLLARFAMPRPQAGGLRPAAGH
jgi:hypothetical protein